ncbi:MAG: adenosylcobalamin-dependent ribonucleoside-diphosphate reductase [Rhodospirillaceae bacterium]|nr:adenosylcobalamin-dependent ribonucleoside-diphosphate reductase [Rhodospirillaceae bacterium]
MTLTGIARQIWDMKYRPRGDDGAPLDATIEDTWSRVARAAASVEADAEGWADRFYAALEDFRFLPAGRILAGAGTGRQVTLFNCFVMGRIPDSMEGIFQALKEAALTLQQGGGIGYDFSTLRPKGAPVHGVGADASGPLSFMDVWDAMCRTIMSAGSRRGAMMATLRCDHPDIEAFVDAKRDAARLRMFNLSVLVTDAFMAAVDQGRPWDLAFEGRVFRTVDARALWERIMHATYEVAEPGVIFIDRINQANNLAYCEEIFATNPCGEQPLPPYGACLLGSINLPRFVDQPFTEAATLNLEALRGVVGTAVRLLDNVIDISGFALAEQRHEAQAKRRIGLGVTGLADALILCGVRYGSPRAVELTQCWLRALRDAAYAQSVDLAREKGAFPLFDAAAYLERPMVADLDAEVRDGIARHGIRNGLLTSIAPTGTISLLAGNVSSGVEPVFANSYRRTVMMADGTRQTEEVEDFAHREFRARFGADAALPAAFVETASLEPADHLAIQAACQPFVDSSISKTINCPEDLDFGAFKSVYREAYRLGCKGCTTYRPNPVTGAVLEAALPETAATAGAKPMLVAGGGEADAQVVYISEPLSRPEELAGRTYKLRWPDSDHAIYVTVNDVVQEMANGEVRHRPFEVFINSKNMEHYAWTVALTRMISAVFRRGGDVSFVVEELKAVFDPRGGHWMGGRYVPSLLAAIGQVIERHMISIGFLPAPVDERSDPPAAEDRPRRGCPRCGMPGLVRSENCDLCLNCGYSRCA